MRRKPNDSSLREAICRRCEVGTDTSGVDSSEAVAGVAVVSVVEDSDCPSAGGSRLFGYFWWF